MPHARPIPLLAEEWRDSRAADAPGWSVRHNFTSLRSDHPVCAFASLGADTPPLRGGEFLAIIFSVYAGIPRFSGPSLPARSQLCRRRGLPGGGQLELGCWG